MNAVLPDPSGVPATTPIHTTTTEGAPMSTDTAAHHGHGHHGHVPTSEQHPDADAPRKSWALLGVALAAQILVVLDISVVNTALPSIGRSLSLSGSDLQWLVTSYLMMSGGGLLLGGRISDLLSRRRVFLTGLALFTTASLLSGFATSGGQLIATRSIQGLSAALLTPSALSLIMTTYAGAQRKAALALWGAVGSLGVAAGVLIGGAITTWASWQFIFWVNGPVGLVALVVGRAIIVRDTVERPTLSAFDIPGAVTVIGGLAALVYGLGGTASHGWWSVHTMSVFAGSAILLVVFLKLESRAARPLFPPHVWKLDSLVSGTAVMLGVTGVLVGAVFLTSIFLQTVLGFSALRTGLAFLPFALAITAGTLVARHLLGHVSPRTIATAGLIIDVAAALVLSTATSGAHFGTDVLPGLVALGLGVGMVFVPVSVTSMSGIPASHAGVASGFLMTGHEIGAALGVAVLSAVASTAGSLTTAAGAADAFGRGFIGAAVLAGVVAVVAFVRMPKVMSAGGGGHLHMH
jgi:EmrB/QacA subfamily drug resistance transporter